VITIMDLVTRKWICEVVSAEETGTQVQVAFCEALELEGLLDLIDARAVGLADRSVDDGVGPILLAVSDNGPQMTWGSTREFMAMCAIAQHFGRPGTPRSVGPRRRATWPSRPSSARLASHSTSASHQRPDAAATHAATPTPRPTAVIWPAPTPRRATLRAAISSAGEIRRRTGVSSTC